MFWCRLKNNAEDGIICFDILPPRIGVRHRRRSIVPLPCRKIGDGCAIWVGILCLNTDKRRSENRRPSNGIVLSRKTLKGCVCKSPLKLVATILSTAGGVPNAAKTALTTNSSKLRHLNTWRSPTTKTQFKPIDRKSSVKPILRSIQIESRIALHFDRKSDLRRAMKPPPEV